MYMTLTAIGKLSNCPPAARVLAQSRFKLTEANKMALNNKLICAESFRIGINFTSEFSHPTFQPKDLEITFRSKNWKIHSCPRRKHV
jgi:hypothetical protein